MVKCSNSEFVNDAFALVSQSKFIYIHKLGHGH